MYQINVVKAVNGIILNIGCRSYVFESIQAGCDELSRFLQNPDKVEQEYRGKYDFAEYGALLEQAREQPVEPAETRPGGICPPQANRY